MMKRNALPWVALVLLGISAGAGILTFSYQRWYFLLRMAVILPVAGSLFLPNRLGRILWRGFGGIGAAVFGFLVYVWSVYPFGKAFPGMGKWVALGMEIGLFLLFSLIHGLSGIVLRKAAVWRLVAGIPVLLVLTALLIYHLFIEPAGIAIEFVSYLPFYAVLVFTGKT